MKKLFLCLSILCAFFSCKKEEGAIVKRVSVNEAKTVLLKEGIQVIDVRTPAELEGGVIEGAANINFQSPTFDAELEKLDKEKPVFVYCQGGVRSASAAKKMKAKGFKEIYDLAGGFSKW